MIWHSYFIQLAEVIAQKSKDPSTKVGAVIVNPHQAIISTGYNDFPRGVIDNTPERRERPIKYKFTEHAERNAIYNAARHGIPLDGCALYMNWEPIPCTDCARALIQSGISLIVGPARIFKQNWTDDLRIAKIMLEEAGIKKLTWDVDI